LRVTEAGYEGPSSSGRGGAAGSGTPIKQGAVVQIDGNGWSYEVYTATPGIPGDSGSAFLNSAGRAMGVLSTVQIAPLAGSNGVGDLGREINYMHANSSFASTQLEPGTQPFNPNLVGAVLGG
jgi:hypothetical protein